MKFKEIKNKKWFNGMLIACTAVTLFVLLSNIGKVLGVIGAAISFFMPLIFGAIIAYMINPLAKKLSMTLFKKVKRRNVQWTLSAVLALIIVVVVVGFMLGILIPQLIDSIRTFSANFNTYLEALQNFLEKGEISKFIDLKAFIDSSETAWNKLFGLISDNMENIMSASADFGKSFMNWILGFILSIYLLMAKRSVKVFCSQLGKALFDANRYDAFKTFWYRCDGILSHYIAYSLIEGIMVGLMNALFMMIMRMQYVGMISVVVALTNLIPTFGPIFGGVVGAFILLMVKPWHALAFIIFTLVLQTVDGYIIKPNMFGDSLGVSGLLILITIITGGKMFGVPGILLSIPFAAILDFVYKDYILVKLRENREKKDREAAGEADGSAQKTET
ncbi:MAG: AI-2E family transporter [Lachnospiraceae bacterium]|nr:AI-2E family transporter [Lachnospiraceae bacterium]